MSPESQIAIILLIVILVGAYIFFTYQQKPSSAKLNEERENVADNLTKMRRLWTEGNYLTRTNAIEQVAGYLGANASQERILANANQVGRNMGTLYGSSNGDQFAQVLRERHTIMQNITLAARQHKDTSTDIAQLKANTQNIVKFLTNMNPSFDAQRLESFLNCYADHNIKQIHHTAKHETISSMNSFDSSNKTLQEMMDYMETEIWNHKIGGPRY